MANQLTPTLYVFFLASFLSGCASLSSPGEPDEGKAFTFPASYEDLWEATVGTLAAEWIPIAEQDKILGMIRSEEFPIQQAEYLKWAEDTEGVQSGFATIFLNLSRFGSGASKIKIAVSFQDARRSVIRPRGRDRTSTGVFENALAARIHARFVAKKYPSMFQLVIGCDFRWDDLENAYRVSNLKPASLGEEQGFQEGDLVTKIDGRAVGISNLFALLSQVRQNQRKTFTVRRQGKTLEFPVDLFYLSADLPWFGMRTEFDAPSRRFRVVESAPKSPAQEAGLQIGDVLLEEEGIRLNSWRNFYQAVTAGKVGVGRKFLIERNGTLLSLQVIPRAIPEDRPKEEVAAISQTEAKAQ